VNRARLLAGALLVLASCGRPVPAPPADIVVLSDRSLTGGYEVVRAVSGDQIAKLPEGDLSYALSAGGDIAEAYLTRPAPGGGTEIDTVDPARSFTLTTIATDTRPHSGSALLDAPELTNFVGRRSVLIVFFMGGEAAGFQHGRLLWSLAADPNGYGLVTFAGKHYLERAAGWRSLALDTGAIGPVAYTCMPGPIVELGGSVIQDCGARLSVGNTPVPAFAPQVIKLGDTAAILRFSNGELWRVDTSSARRIGSTKPEVAASVPSPDRRLLYVPTEDGVEAVSLPSGSSHRLLSAKGISSVAVSRDGNFLYLIAGGRLTTYEAASGTRIGSFGTDRGTILLVAGG